MRMSLRIQGRQMADWTAPLLMLLGLLLVSLMLLVSPLGRMRIWVLLLLLGQ
jgi:hypothetical protein